MNSRLKTTSLFITSIALAACGSSSNKSNPSDDSGHSHEGHSHSVVITQINSTQLSFLEEGAPEAIANVGSAGGTLLLSNSGEQAAIFTTSTVNFLMSHDEHEEDGEEHEHEEEHALPELSEFALSGTNIFTTNTVGHFSVLVDGSTSFVPYESPSAETLNLGITETYPALLLDEEHSLVLAFDGTNAVVYEGTTATTDSISCATVSSTAHAGEFAVVSCNSGNFSVKIAEGETEHEAVIADLSISTPILWATRAGVFVGQGADANFYVLEENEAESLELESSFAVPEGMCNWAIDSLEAQLFVMTPTNLIVLDHDGTVQTSLTLDETQNAVCADLRITAANNAVYVFDNAGSVMYEIDKASAQYHIHGRENLSINDVASAAVFHAAGSETDAHEH